VLELNSQDGQALVLAIESANGQATSTNTSNASCISSNSTSYEV